MLLAAGLAMVIENGPRNDDEDDDENEEERRCGLWETYPRSAFTRRHGTAA